MKRNTFGSASGSARRGELSVVNCIPQDIGWSPIQHMALLAAELLSESLLIVPPETVSLSRKALSLIMPRRARQGGRDACLVICRGPADLIRVLRIQGWKRRFRVLAAWIIDSYWLDHIPPYIKLVKPYDHFFVTSVEDVDEWRDTTGTHTTWLPWGSDALRLGSDRSERQWDVVRVGRQPTEWNDDRIAGAAAKAAGLKYRGRPPTSGRTPADNERCLMQIYSDAKFLLAFSNLANPEGYTHPRRDYLTGRWVDALACGATVAGVPPRGSDAQQLLWPEATLDLGTVRRDEGLEILVDASRAWEPQIACKNHEMALKRLDWRLRFDTIAKVLDVRRGALDAELQLLESRIRAFEAAKPAEVTCPHHHRDLRELP